MSTKTAVFQVKAIKNTNTAQIKSLGAVDKSERYIDERMDIADKKNKVLNNGTKALTIMPNVYAIFYKCNISDAFLLGNKRLPVMYTTIMYERPFATGHLFDITLYFEISNDTKKINNPQELFNTTFNGKYYIDITVDNKKDKIDIDNFAGYDETIMKFKELLENSEMKEIMNTQLKKRDVERRQRLGGNIDYTVSKPTINFKDLVDMHERGESVNEYLEKNTS
jgi:hypothetical protein